MKTHTILLLSALLLGGCATGPKIVDVDPEKLEQERLGELATVEEPTPPHVTVANAKGILVDVDKAEPIIEDDVEREVWIVTATNNNTKDKCVTLIWKLLDFQYQTSETSEFLLEAHYSKEIGVMVQQTMTIAGVEFAPPASGFVKAMRVRKTIEDAKEGEECLYITKEKKVKTR